MNPSGTFVVGQATFDQEREPRMFPGPHYGAEAIDPVVPQPDQQFRCRTPNCGQVLARIGSTGGIYPQVTGAYYERRRIIIPRCPGCGRKIRIPIPDD